MIRATAIPLLLSALLGAADRPALVRIPPGSFEMGCDPRDKCSETLPRRRVEFAAPFWMTRTEITVAQFRDFVRATGYRTYSETAGERLTWRAPGFRLDSRQPVVLMTLDDARAYCKWLGGRVPTEAEWEYAARAGAATHHYWGEEIDGRYLWFRENSGGRPQPVGRKLPNAWGLYDVEGNAIEWVDGGGPYTSIRKEGYGSLRGGSWILCPEPYPPDAKGRRNGRQIGLTVPFPGGAGQQFSPTWRRDDGGFRCACSNALY